MAKNTPDINNADNPTRKEAIEILEKLFTLAEELGVGAALDYSWYELEDAITRILRTYAEKQSIKKRKKPLR